MGSDGLTKEALDRIAEADRVRAILNQLKSHPNFKMPVPDPTKEGAIGYTCRCIAQLISPVQEEGEDYHVECVDLAKAVDEFSDDIQDAWLDGCAVDPKP